MRVLKISFLIIFISRSFFLSLQAQGKDTQIIQNFFKTNISETYLHDILIEDTKYYVNQLSQQYLHHKLTRSTLQREIQAVLNSLYNKNNHTVKTDKNKYEAEVSNLIHEIIQLTFVTDKRPVTDDLYSNSDDVEKSREGEDKTQVDSLSSEIQELRAKIEILIENNKQERKTQEEIIRKEKEAEKVDSLMRYKVSNIATNYVGDNAQQILNKAYPLTMNKMRWKNLELLGASNDNSHYNVTIRLNYFNLFRQLHYLDLRFKFDSKGEFDSWEFVNHSDVIAPREITFGKLLNLD